MPFHGFEGIFVQFFLKLWKSNLNDITSKLMDIRRYFQMLQTKVYILAKFADKKISLYILIGQKKPLVDEASGLHCPIRMRHVGEARRSITKTLPLHQVMLGTTRLLQRCLTTISSQRDGTELVAELWMLLQNQLVEGLKWR